MEFLTAGLKRTEELRTARAEREPDGTRGIDRVPERLRVEQPAPEHVVEHTDAPHRDRRAMHINQGRAFRPGQNQPYVNPARAEKKARAKARKGGRS